MAHPTEAFLTEARLLHSSNPTAKEFLWQCFEPRTQRWVTVDRCAAGVDEKTGEPRIVLFAAKIVAVKTWKRQAAYGRRSLEKLWRLCTDTEASKSHLPP